MWSPYQTSPWRKCGQWVNSETSSPDSDKVNEVRAAEAKTGNGVIGTELSGVSGVLCSTKDGAQALIANRPGSESQIHQ